MASESALAPKSDVGEDDFRAAEPYALPAAGPQVPQVPAPLATDHRFQRDATDRGHARSTTFDNRMGESDPPGKPGGARRPTFASETQSRAQANQSRLAIRAPKPRIKGLPVFEGYKPAGAKISYSDNKVGVMPDVASVIAEIADEAGIDLTDSEVASRFLDALVTDVYTNPYSDKSTFDGDVVVGTFSLPRHCIKTVIEKKVGTSHRRYARAMAPYVVQVMTDNPDYYDLLDRRCVELNLSTRAEAIEHFDGNDGLVIMNRQASQVAAEVKFLKITKDQTHRAYTVTNSSVAKQPSNDYVPVGGHSATGGDGTN